LRISASIGSGTASAGILDVTAGVEHIPRAACGRPFERARPLDIDREHAAHAATDQLGGLAACVAERLCARDLEREMLELPAAGAWVGAVRVDADVRSDVIDPGGPGQQIGRALELRPGVGLDQRGELQVPGASRGIGGGHVD
jgi:hypothetical protein